MNNLLKIAAQSALLAALTAIAAPAFAQTTAPASCTAPHVDAALADSSVLDVPPIASAVPMSGSAIVTVALDASGKPESAEIIDSTGWAILDAVAKRAVLARTYTPETDNCVPVAGSYEVRVDF